jgi:hypothetical protein
LPVVLCLNMWDAAVAAGIRIDCAELSTRLGMPVVPTSASRREGLQQLESACLSLLQSSSRPSSIPEYLSPEICRAVNELHSGLKTLPAVSPAAAGFLAAQGVAGSGRFGGATAGGAAGSGICAGFIKVTRTAASGRPAVAGSRGGAALRGHRSTALFGPDIRQQLRTITHRSSRQRAHAQHLRAAPVSIRLTARVFNDLLVLRSAERRCRQRSWITFRSGRFFRWLLVHSAVCSRTG